MTDDHISQQAIDRTIAVIGGIHKGQAKIILREIERQKRLARGEREQEWEKERAQLIESRDGWKEARERLDVLYNKLEKEKAALEQALLAKVIPDFMIDAIKIKERAKLRETIKKLPRYNKIWEDMEKSEDGSWVYIDEVLAVLDVD